MTTSRTAIMTASASRISVEARLGSKGVECCGEAVPVGTVGREVDRVDEMPAERIPFEAGALDEQDRDRECASLPRRIEDECSVGAGGSTARRVRRRLSPGWLSRFGVSVR